MDGLINFVSPSGTHNTEDVVTDLSDLHIQVISNYLLIIVKSN